jgi:hypothetical protein
MSGLRHHQIFFLSCRDKGEAFSIAPSGDELRGTTERTTCLIPAIWWQKE